MKGFDEIIWTAEKNGVHSRFRKAVKILIAVVIGALLLAGLYALFSDTVMPTLPHRIQKMFN